MFLDPGIKRLDLSLQLVHRPGVVLHQLLDALSELLRYLLHFAVGG